MVKCLCGKSLDTKDEFESHISKCPEISDKFFEIIRDDWRNLKDDSTLMEPFG